MYTQAKKFRKLNGTSKMNGKHIQFQLKTDQNIIYAK